MPPQSRLSVFLFFVFFFNDTATTEIYTLSLHDALPIYRRPALLGTNGPLQHWYFCLRSEEHTSELQSRFGISYAVFCLKKKKITDAREDPPEFPRRPPPRPGRYL